ncbi:uncharacterized protein LOC127242966 [Andrographis paniculata]|uniref:uncharacterized protein LOC127242966 n=1 Tax=Andrographis paniculata TaxID=175694 RepID=UPI0021E8A439|nr:uncharacterized protein LOC127242966 [Andrographis paniculata]
MSPAVRPPKCHPPPPPPPLPPPSPKILNFPLSRRTRRAKITAARTQQKCRLSEKLHNLFDQEHHNKHPTAEYDGDGSGAAGLEEEEEEQWRFQAEMLRAECNLLRMEKQLAFNKIENNRAEIEAILRSSLQSLISGRKKICRGANAGAVLEEEIDGLARKLEELNSGGGSTSRSHQLPNCSNFDTKANLLRRHLDEQRRMFEAENESEDWIGNPSNSTLKRTIDEAPEIKCTGRCKSLVRRLVEQVRAETEQWSQMQEMLRQVRDEMVQLQASRDFWENRARSLRHTLDESEKKMLAYEAKVSELQRELFAIKWEIRESTADPNPVPLAKQLENEKHESSHRMKKKSDENYNKFGDAVEEHKERTLDKDRAPISLGKHLAKEKKMFLHRLKENRSAKAKQCSSRVIGEVSPLRDIGNSSSCLARHSSRAAAGVLSSPPETFRTRESFRK